jgi:hypothetical protein
VDVRAPRRLLAGLLALAATLALAAPAAAQPDLRRPASQISPPAFYEMSAREVVALGDRRPEVRRERRRHGALFAIAYTKGASLWQVSYFAGGVERVQLMLDDRTGRVLEAWTGHQVRWRMARGYDGQFGRKLNAPYLWIPLCVLFLLPFVDPRRPFRLLHLDLLVLVGFGVSHLYFNRGDIGVSVPLVYPVLAYLLARMLFAGFRGVRGPPEGRLFPLFPVVAVALGIVFLVGFRVALNVTDSRTIDVGQSSVVGADRIADGRELYGEPFSKTDQHGDTYGPVTYLLYVPFEQVLPWKGKPDPAAAHAAAIAFDLLTIAGLLLLGRRLRGWPLGVGLAYAWAANPYSLFVMQSDANDTAVAMLLVWALVVLGSPVGRGVFIALAAAAKFSPAALFPLFARDRRPRNVVAYAIASAAVLAAVFLPFVPDGGLREIYDRTVGFQLARESPFSVWGQEDALAPLHTALKVGVGLLALVVLFLPRRRTPVQVAALAAAIVIGVQLVVTHWFYLYVVWFLPLVLVALFAPLAGGRREPLGPGLELDTGGVDHLGDQPVPAGAHQQLQ